MPTAILPADLRPEAWSPDGKTLALSVTPPLDGVFLVGRRWSAGVEAVFGVSVSLLSLLA